MAANSVTIRRTRRQDVPAIVAMLVDDHLGSAREHLTDPLPASRLGFTASHVGMTVRF